MRMERTIGVRLDTETLKALKKIAEAEDRSVSSVVRRWIKEKLRQLSMKKV